MHDRLLHRFEPLQLLLEDSDESLFVLRVVKLNNVLSKVRLPLPQTPSQTILHILSTIQDLSRVHDASHLTVQRQTCLNWHHEQESSRYKQSEGADVEDG